MNKKKGNALIILVTVLKKTVPYSKIPKRNTYSNVEQNDLK